MKAIIVRKGLGPVQAPPVPAESEVRITKATHQNGDHADAGEVLYELSGDEPLKDDDFVVLTDNMKCCIHRMSGLLCLEAEGNCGRVYRIGSSMLNRRPLR